MAEQVSRQNTLLYFVGFEVDVVGIAVVGFGLVDVIAPKWF